MVCVYCGADTQVTNSRHQRRHNQVWRRRKCVKCGAVFSSIESPDYATTLVVRKGTAVEPFSRDALFVSILQAVGHRDKPIKDAGGLTATIMANVLAQSTGASVTPNEIVKAALPVLKRFDKAAAVQYAAYHQH